jgi:hypothetical protein
VTYDARAAAFYDDYGEREWTRVSLDDETRSALVVAELELAAQRGAVHAGSGVIAVVRRT